MPKNAVRHQRSVSFKAILLKMRAESEADFWRYHICIHYKHAAILKLITLFKLTCPNPEQCAACLKTHNFYHRQSMQDRLFNVAMWDSLPLSHSSLHAILCPYPSLPKPALIALKAFGRRGIKGSK